MVNRFRQKPGSVFSFVKPVVDEAGSSNVVVLLADLVTTLPRELLRVKLFVNHAEGCHHPLDIARADLAVVATRVSVLHRTLLHDRYRLEAAVRMFAHAGRLCEGGNSAGPA
jgi:hypothetical protein